jgi:hypothetical protein
MLHHYETEELPDPEVALGLLLAENAERLAQDDMISVVRGSLGRLVSTQFYYAAEQRQAVAEVASTLDEAFPILRVSAGLAFRKDEGAPGGSSKQPTGEIEFDYSIGLSTPWEVGADPMGGEIMAGELLSLDGIEFRRGIGKVLVDREGGKRFIKADIGANAQYYVADSNGDAVLHPDPATLFPHFSPPQELELERMALATTDAFIEAYGLNPDVLWDRINGIWWDVNAPGARQMWRDVDRQYGLESPSSGFEQPD